MIIEDVTAWIEDVTVRIENVTAGSEAFIVRNHLSMLCDRSAFCDC